MINVINKLKQSDLPSLEEGGERLSLLELNALVRRSLEQCLPDEYWIQAELSDGRSIRRGIVIWNLCRKILVVIIS